MIKKKTPIRNVLINLFFIVFTLLWSYPFIWMAFSSFKPGFEMLMSSSTLFTDSPTFDNYIRAWDAANISTAFINSIIVTCAVVVLVLIIASLTGYGLGRGKMPGKKTIIGFILVSMFIPKSVLTLPLYQVINGLGMNNSLLGVIFGEAGPAHVFHIMLFISFFSTIPDELEEAAKLEGANFPTIFFRIMLPLAKPVIATVVIFNFISAWNDFMIPLIFTLNKPSLRTLAVGMYTFFGEESTDWAGLAAASVITIVPVVVIFLSLQKYFIRGLEGAVKG